MRKLHCSLSTLEQYFRVFSTKSFSEDYFYKIVKLDPDPCIKAAGFGSAMRKTAGSGAVNKNPQLCHSETCFLSRCHHFLLVFKAKFFLNKILFLLNFIHFCSSKLKTLPLIQIWISVRNGPKFRFRIQIQCLWILNTGLYGREDG